MGRIVRGAWLSRWLGGGSQPSTRSYGRGYVRGTTLGYRALGEVHGNVSLIWYFCGSAVGASVVHVHGAFVLLVVQFEFFLRIRRWPRVRWGAGCFERFWRFGGFALGAGAFAACSRSRAVIAVTAAPRFGTTCSNPVGGSRRLGDWHRMMGSLLVAGIMVRVVLKMRMLLLVPRFVSVERTPP